jgi:hypothetical protein
MSSFGARELARLAAGVFPEAWNDRGCVGLSQQMEMADSKCVVRDVLSCVSNSPALMAKEMMAARDVASFLNGHRGRKMISTSSVEAILKAWDAMWRPSLVRGDAERGIAR